MATGYGKRVRRLMVDFVAGKAPTAPANWFVGLSTANPGDANAGLAEPTSTGSYARTADMLSSGWTAAHHARERYVPWECVPLDG